MVFNVKASAERKEVDHTDLPYFVHKLENVPIPMKDGASLYAHIWVPQDALAGKVKVGALVEYLPYRKNDFTAIRDSIRHPYYAGFGLASIRVDMRGCGDSDGEIFGEYLEQEQSDNLEIFDWICAQQWSNGKIGQFGKSWGGFNGLQIAAKQHPALKTIITLMSTDDRYSDDVHYRGGCLLASDMLWWASTMFVYNARPQDPRVRPEWKENWLKRLDLEPNVVEWLKHQRRDDFWKHGSVCEDYSKLDIPVLAVGGWRDGYTNAVIRMANKLPHPDSKGIIGPWVHEYPEVATPHPGIGYNQLAVSWFSKYLSDDASVLDAVNSKLNIPADFDMHSLGRLTAYVQEPCSVAEAYDHCAGKWVTQDATSESCVDFFVDPTSATLQKKKVASPDSLEFSGALEHGLFRGTWCPFGQDGDFPADQKIEDSKCLTIDTEALTEDYECLGFPSVVVKVSSSTQLANLTVRLVDLNPETKENYLVSWGMINLAHANGTSEQPELLEVDKVYTFKFNLDSVGYRFVKKHRIRLAFSTADWPSSWPSAITPSMKLYAGTRFTLPLVRDNHRIVAQWPLAESLPPCDRAIVREDTRTRKVVYDYVSRTWTIDDFSDEGKRTIVSNGAELGSWNKHQRK